MLECLGLLCALSRCLDIEYKYGVIQCWKNLAEQLGIDASIYEMFEYCVVRSPTEQLLDYVISSVKPELTIGELKHYLLSMDRFDIIGILQGYIHGKEICLDYFP